MSATTAAFALFAFIDSVTPSSCLSLTAASRCNHLVQRIIPNSPASFTDIQLNEILVTLFPSPPPSSPLLTPPQLQVDGVDVSPLDTASVRSLILGRPGSTVDLLLSLTGRVTIKRTQYVCAQPASPPALARPAVLSSPCFPTNAAATLNIKLDAESQEDC